MAAITKEKIARIRFMSLVINPYAVGNKKHATLIILNKPLS